MKNKPILLVSATRQKTAVDTKLYQSLQDLEQYVDPGVYEAQIETDNTAGLSTVYNKYTTDENLKRYSSIIYVHDDVYIDDVKVFEKIIKCFKQGYSLVGLAGGSKVKIQSPALWHVMTEKQSQSGSVAHPYTTDTAYTTTFGPVPVRCLIMDGLFLAINCERYRANMVRFDEQFEFHHYDIDFCLQSNKSGHKMTTCNINVIHSSPGLLNPNSKIFLDSQQKFLNKYVKN